MCVNEVHTPDGSQELLYAEMYAWSASPTRLCVILLKDVEMHIISFHPFHGLWWCSYQNFLHECKYSIRWQIYIYIFHPVYQHPNWNPIIHLTLTPENIYSDRIAILIHMNKPFATTPRTGRTWPDSSMCQTQIDSKVYSAISALNNKLFPIRPWVDWCLRTKV